MRYAGVESRVAKKFLTPADKDNLFTIDHFPLWYRLAVEYTPGIFYYYPVNDKGVKYIVATTSVTVSSEGRTAMAGEAARTSRKDWESVGSVVSEAADSIPVHDAAGLFGLRLLRRARGRHLSVLQVGLISRLSHQRLAPILHLLLVPRHQRSIDAAVSGRNHHHDTHRAANHACNDLRAVRPADTYRPVTLANTFFIAADPAGWTRRPGGVTRATLLGLTLQAVAEHLCRYAADVPAFEIHREAALHRIYLPIYKTDGEGRQRKRGRRGRETRNRERQGRSRETECKPTANTISFRVFEMWRGLRTALLTPVNQPLHPVLEVPQLAVTLPGVSRQLQLPQSHQGLEGDSVQGHELVAGQRQPGESLKPVQEAFRQPTEAIGGQVKPLQPPQPLENLFAKPTLPWLPFKAWMASVLLLGSNVTRRTPR
ncbi:hypothetical protein INR49_019232 [Caranx melampygus]|nr:hypothetical protein INR49_019232 [Caranx melampygus]